MPREVVCTNAGSEEKFLDLFNEEGTTEWSIGAAEEWFSSLLWLVYDQVSEGFDWTKR